jgi:hypothetical protein
MSYETPRPDPRVIQPRRYGDLYPEAGDNDDTPSRETPQPESHTEGGPADGTPVEKPYFNGLNVPAGYQLNPGRGRRRKAPILVGLAACLLAGALITLVLIMPALGVSNGLVDAWFKNGNSSENQVNIDTADLILPVDGAMINERDVTLIWSPVPDADSYHLLVRGPSTNVNISSTSCQYELVQLSDGVYSWNVIAVTDGHYGLPSITRTISVQTILGIPILTSPESGRVFINQTPTFVWSPISGSEEYRIQLSVDSNFSQLVVDLTISSTSYQPNLKMLDNTTYYWRVMAQHDNIWSEWSATNSFFEAPSAFHFSHSWTFSNDHTEWTVNLSIPAEDYYDARSETRGWVFSYQVYAHYVVPTDNVVKNLSAALKTMAVSKGYNQYETANFVLSFVQSIPYSLDSDSVGLDEYPRYPVETLVDLTGDCEDKAALYASIIQSPSFSMDAILVALTDGEIGHMAVGLFVTPPISGMFFWTYLGRAYFYCETTGQYPVIGLPYESSSWSYTIIPC